MNTCVSDEYHIVNIQGIRYVSWGETRSTYMSNPGNPYYVQVTYKGNNQSFSYKTESMARAFYEKIRLAMDKTYQDSKKDTTSDSAMRSMTEGNFR